MLVVGKDYNSRGRLRYAVWQVVGSRKMVGPNPVSKRGAEIVLKVLQSLEALDWTYPITPEAGARNLDAVQDPRLRRWLMNHC
jgi:hypothetical protein